MNNVYKQVKRSFAVISALFITVVSSKNREGHQNFCGSERLVECAKPLSVLDSGLTFASSKPDLDRMCPDLKDAIKCIHTYTRHCMSLEESAHFKTLFNGTVHMVHHLCYNKSYQEEYLKYAPCMKKVENQNEVCLKKYTTAMKQIESKTEQQATSEPDLLQYRKKKREAADEGIKAVCCSFQQYVECSTHTMRRACGEDAAQFSREFLDKMSSNLIRLHCENYGRRECGLLSASAGDDFKKTSSVLLILSILAYFVS